jgi:hypothetical protein
MAYKLEGMNIPGNGRRPFQKNWVALFEAIEKEIINRDMDNNGKGMIRGGEVTHSGGLQIKIAPCLGYDSEGHRIDSTAEIGVTLNPDETKQIALRHKFNVTKDPDSIHTDGFMVEHRVNSFDLVISDTALDTDLKLATVTTDSATVTSIVDLRVIRGQDLLDEINARIDADMILQNLIDSEATTRTNIDTSLQNQINAEATTRANTDTSLQNQINAEATTRANTDTSLQNQINAEVTNRTNTDTSLQNQINSEHDFVRNALDNKVSAGTGSAIMGVEPNGTPRYHQYPTNTNYCMVTCKRYPTNLIQIDWDGSQIKFYVDNIHVKTL